MNVFKDDSDEPLIMITLDNQKGNVYTSGSVGIASPTGTQQFPLTCTTLAPETQ